MLTNPLILTVCLLASIPDAQCRPATPPPTNIPVVQPGKAVHTHQYDPADLPSTHARHTEIRSFFSEEASLPRGTPDSFSIDQNCDFWIQSYEPPYISTETTSLVCLTTDEQLRRSILQCLNSNFAHMDEIGKAIDRHCYHISSNPHMRISLASVSENIALRWVCLLCFVVGWLSVWIIRYQA
jgi:hypothetical protein